MMGEQNRGSPDDDLRIGPYDVFKTLVEAPGGKIIEARDSSGEQRLLQTARCRPARNKSEEAELGEYVRMIAAATDHFDADPDVRVIAHGALPQSDGSKLLFWALPWKEGAERLGHGPELIETQDDLIAVAISLLERVAERHERGRLDPLLSEQLVIVRPAGGAIVAGVPIHLPVEWIAVDAMKPRFAPEEMLRFEPTRSGDMWRVGQTLRALAQNLGPLPAAIRRIIDALADPDPELRMGDPEKAIKELELMRAISGRTPAVDRRTDRPDRSDRSDRPDRPDLLERAATEISAELSGPRPVPEASARPKPDFERTERIMHRGREDLGEITDSDELNRSTLDTNEKDPATAEGLRAAMAEHDPQIEDGEEGEDDDELEEDEGDIEDAAESGTALLEHDTIAHDPSGDAKPRRLGVDTWPDGQSDDLPTPEALRASFEATQTDRLPIANLRTAAPAAAAGTMKGIADAPTLLEVKPPASLRATAASALEAHRRRPAGDPHAGLEPDPMLAPTLLGRDTVVDVRLPPDLERELTGEEPTIDEGLRSSGLRDPSLRLNILDPVELTGSNDDALTPGSGRRAVTENVWDRAKQRGGRSRVPGIDAGKDPLKPAGPSGTVVGVRDLGPAGTLVGINPVRAKERLQAERERAGVFQAPPALLPGPPSSDPNPNQPRGSTIVGVPSLKFRGRDNSPEDAESFPITGAEARSIVGGDTGEMQVPRALRSVAQDSSDEFRVPERPQLTPGPQDRSIPSYLDPAENPPAPQQVRDAVDLSVADPAETLVGPPAPGPVIAAPPGPTSGPKVAPIAAPAAPPKKKMSILMKIAIAFSILILIASVTVIAGRELPPPKPKATAQKPNEVTPAGEVVLVANPADAVVVGEGDGRVLGRTPMTFLVAPSSLTPVLITARDREPQRLTLPDRGTVNITLARLSSTKPCDVLLSGVGDRKIEGVAADVKMLDERTAPKPKSKKAKEDPPVRFRIPGQAVLRAESAGAWVVACPELGGKAQQDLEDRPEAHEERLHVAQPENALFYVDGKLGGAIPFRTDIRTGFVRVRVESVDGAAIERWVPVFVDTLLKMPSPPPRSDD